MKVDVFAPWVVVTSMVPETSARPSESEFIKGLALPRLEQRTLRALDTITKYYHLLSPTQVTQKYLGYPLEKFENEILQDVFIGLQSSVIPT